MSGRQKIRNALLAATFGTTVLGLSNGAAFAEPASGVVELFTSQGCSSCPPADKVLAELSESDDVLALAWHVDYWDYIGWKDTFASPDYTARQRAYARAQSERMIYTPQAMINGRKHMNGGAGTSINRTLASHESGGALYVDVDLKSVGDEVKLVMEPTKAASASYAVTLVTFDRQEEVEITRGENHGKTITYHNIVRDSMPVMTWKGEGVNMMLAQNVAASVGKDMGLAVLVQELTTDGDPGPIVGAAQLK
jgi:hypothetical protein